MEQLCQNVLLYGQNSTKPQGDIFNVNNHLHKSR